MEKSSIKVGILPNQFLKSDGTFDKQEAIKLSGKIGGICYDEEGFEHLTNEPLIKTLKRVDMTLNHGHHSVYDHIVINFNFQNIPKILAMLINNEHQYTTSEKSARYTRICKSPIFQKSDETTENEKMSNLQITGKEVDLYNKWLEIFKVKIKEQYGDFYNDSKILKLAQENARYLITVFMPTQMIYSTSLRQINYLASWMQDYILNENVDNLFQRKLVSSMDEFLARLKEINVLEDGLMKNEKQRHFSLFAKDLEKKEDFFGDVYSTTYKTSFAELAQAQRHRTINYQMQFLNNNEYFIPLIIKDDDVLKEEWLKDIRSLKSINPQGELILVNERGIFENFILKCKERLCTEAQLEIMLQTRETLLKYKEALEKNGNPLAKDIEKYSHGARCTFPDFSCTSDCKFVEGKTLIRKI